jgi:hypothetical protein
MARVAWALVLFSGTLFAGQQQAAQAPAASSDPNNGPAAVTIQPPAQKPAASSNAKNEPAADTPANPAPSPMAKRNLLDKIVVPKNTTIPLELKNTINSRTAYQGEAIYCETIYPITVGNRIVIPVGTYVKGEVTAVVRPGRVKGKAQIGIRFNNITLPNGTTRPLRATLSGFGGTGKEGFNREESKIKGAGTKGEDAGKVAQTTVAGAEGGIITGAISGGHAGEGAALGSLAGAAGGLIWVLASRGKEIVLAPGTNLELQLAAPLRFDEDDLAPPSDYRTGPQIPRRDPGPGI